MPRIAVLAVAVLAVLAPPASASIINVQNQNDDGVGSLRKAIADAQPNDEIQVPPGTYNLTSGELDVGKNLTIVGAGSGAGPNLNTIVDAGGKSRVFNIHDGTVTLKDIRIAGGNATQGGGIFATSTTNLDGVTVSGNVAGGGGVDGEGGGIAFSGPQLNLMSSSVTNNRAGGGAGGSGIGGGIKVLLQNNADRTVSLDRTTVSGNTAGGNGGNGYGGGIDASGEGTNTKLTLTLGDSTVANNVAGGGTEAYGGGIEAGSGNNNAELLITLGNSTVSGNRTAVAGGAAGVDYQSGGNSVDQTLIVRNSTVAGNTAPTGGTGGIAFAISGAGSAASQDLTHATIVGNGGRGIQGSALTTARNSIIASNSGGNCDAPFKSTSTNIEDTDTCGLNPMNGDRPNTAPKLNPLGDYGGFTRTMLPRADSPALNKALGLYCTSADQRGVTRPQGTSCDIGSVEAEIANVGVVATLSPKTTVAGKVVTYKFAVKNNGPQVAGGVTLVDKLPAKLRQVSVTGCTGKLASGCRVGDIAFGATRTVTVKARALRSGQVVNKGTVTSFAADPALGNNSASTTLVIRPSLTNLTMKPKSWDDKTTIGFTLSDPGQVTLRFARKGSDGKFHSVGSRKLSNRKRGKNTFGFNGDLDGGRSLSPGSYRLSARVKDAAGRTSPAKSLKFKLLSS